MKKLLILTAIFSLFVFSGCELFSGKNTAAAEEKPNEVVTEKTEIAEDTESNKVETESQKPLQQPVNEPAVDTAKIEPQTVEVQKVQAPQLLDSPESQLAKCLTAKGVKLYTSSTCPHCKVQKDLFKEGLQYLDNTECLAMDGWAQECKDAGIEAVPTWIFTNGEKETGTTKLDVLAEKAGCEYASAEENN